MSLNRRQMLLAAGASLLGPIALGPGIARAARNKTKKVLFFTKSAGFQHSVITRKGEELGHAEKILTALGKEHGFEVVCSKDGRLFEPDRIGEWDAFAFYTTGDLTQEGTDKTPAMSKAGKQALLDAIHDGKGFMGFHCATDSFHSKGNEIDPYIQMIGGEFIVHGAQQKSKLVVTDETFPGAKAFAPTCELHEEWYALKNMQPDLHVILVQDTEGMHGKMYERPPFPETWARQHGKGRVFYTSLGHREDIWENTKMQGLCVGALTWITGQCDIDLTPNIKKVTPKYEQVGG